MKYNLKNKINKKLSIGIIFVVLLSLLSLSPILIADPDNVIAFLSADIDVEMTETFVMEINVTIDANPVDTVAVDNMTFDGTVITTESGNVTAGNMFENGTLDPIVTVNNDSGYIASIVWANETISSVTRTLANISWYAANVGTTTVQMTAGGTAYNGTGRSTTNASSNVTVHPKYPGSMYVNTTGWDTINISWVKRAGTDYVIVEVNTTLGPWSRGEAVEIANTTNTSVVDSELNDNTTYYYQIWSYNASEQLYSIYNASGHNTTDELIPGFSTSLTLLGLTDTWNITFENTSSDATAVFFKYSWCNNSGIELETVELNLTVNTTDVVEWINVTIDDVYDFANGVWHNASNVTVYVSPDNITFTPVHDDDGMGWGRGIDGGTNITINWSTWYGDHSPFDDHGDGSVINENCSIYLRFEFNHTEGMGYGTYHNQSAQGWVIWIGEDQDIHDSDMMTVQLYNYNELEGISDEFPVNTSVDVARPPANLSAFINGTEVEVYIYFVNKTSGVDTWTFVEGWLSVNNSRVEYTDLSTFGRQTEFIWGNTTYIWSVNITAGLLWTNETYTYTTEDEANGADARLDVDNDDNVFVGDLNAVWANRNGQATYDGLYDVDNDSNIFVGDLNTIWAGRS